MYSRSEIRRGFSQAGQVDEQSSSPISPLQTTENPDDDLEDAEEGLRGEGVGGDVTEDSENEDDELQDPNQAAGSRNPIKDQRQPLPYSESLAGDEVIEEDIYEQ